MNDSKMTWGAALNAVAEETRGATPALLAQRAFENVRALSSNIEALEEAIEGADLSAATVDKIRSLAECLQAFGYDGVYLAERFGNE